MGIFKDDSGKTEQATPKRLSGARDKGRTPLSREFTMGGALLVSILAVEFTGPWLIGAFESLMRDGMSLPIHRIGNNETPWLTQNR